MEDGLKSQILAPSLNIVKTKMELYVSIINRSTHVL